MTTVKEYRTTDKSEWGPGKWQDEPDKIQWVDEATGLDCLIVRSLGSGALCGYVGVPETHPYFAVDYSSCSLKPPCGESWCHHTPAHVTEVHGDLTFSGFCREDEPEGHGICHVPFPGRPDRVWWLGFDCAHSNDICPAFDMRFRDSLGESYKPRKYVEQQCAWLALQLVAIKS